MPNFLLLDCTKRVPLFAFFLTMLEPLESIATPTASITIPAATLTSFHAFVRKAKLRLNSNTLSRSISSSLAARFAPPQLKGRARRVMTDGGHKMCVHTVSRIGRFREMS